MDKIKKFFEKKKADTKFKLAGEGHRLNEPVQPPTVNRSAQSQSRSEASTSAAQQQAAAAALARLEKKKDPTPQQRSAAIIRAQALKELELEKQDAPIRELTLSDKTQKFLPADEFAVSGVYYKCPLVGPEVLPKKEIEKLIKEFLYQQLESEEAGLTACLVIHTLNRPVDKVQQCIETLFRYLDNVVQNPTEEKYHKIRVNNKIYQERVAQLEGVQQFLQAAGFQLKSVQNAQQELEDIWVLSNTQPEHIEYITNLRDSLISAEPIRPELDRGLQILMPSQAAKRVELPSDFFWLTAEEIKREQQLKTEQAERGLMLRTRAMRERDEKAAARKYRFTLIRVKFPDGPVLQGTFKVNETMQDVRLFVSEALQEPFAEFSLVSPAAGVTNAADVQNPSLLDLQLCPSALFHFAPAVPSSSGYLKDDLMILMQSM
ncbi:UBX domain-containing protein 6-like [Daphnia carinata]|uniref:UBX domain-containing protein 6-like n=1 Tax=Daphnia carinata TaxID=120202 RepID=UPI00257BB7AC|nr:UBX domain-containing protein 6-like [Daphnia carinata]